ncbi:MAG: twin-arginine translocase TatA/TatE family subunit, partial [Coriobacteriales bacterium]|nr:twin-arginine translocase TatA/TatE family subunit [Coriobacteriales bacterium]
MFGIGGLELVIILVFAFLIFGPDKLPGVIKNVSHIWNSLKGLREQADQVIKAEVVEPLKDIEATINPLTEEGTSVTDKLASKLGLKPDATKKDEKKAEEATGEDKGEDAGTSEGDKAPEAGAASGAVAAAATTATAAKTTSSPASVVSAGPGDESAATKADKPQTATKAATKPDAAAKSQAADTPQAAAKPKP